MGGRKRHHGPVHTLRDACAADLVLRIVCRSCHHWRQMHAYRLLRLRKEKDAPLHVPIAGFRCRQCGQRGEAVITWGAAL